MNIKEYFKEAYRIDIRICSKQEQLRGLNDLATSSYNIVSDMPKDPNRNIHKLENIITKIVDMEQEINSEIDKLVELKGEIRILIKNVQNKEHQTILELRYLCFKKWEEIAVIMGYSIHHLYREHNKALRTIGNLKLDTKKH